ncbi:hypothetical protein FNYG_15293 [Fusarium nygamai]|uniref:Uncharacterized protein n=1 Tax=Gibberella nygamai TaxID=42673 RepID=A0A2K0UGN5_GIBNY|nr:hypothetical protein FNYG_15293 [Fusarium nygamai]
MTALNFSYHVVTVPKKILASISNILAKAELHPKATSFPESKLAEDMLPLSFQVWCVTDNICKGLARAQGIEAPTLEKDLTTIAAMKESIKSASEFLEKAQPDDINKRRDEVVTGVAILALTIGLGPSMCGRMTVLNYINGWSHPNIWFHLNMTYAILRKEGVDIGKQDYLTPFTEGVLTIL